MLYLADVKFDYKKYLRPDLQKNNMIQNQYCNLNKTTDIDQSLFYEQDFDTLGESDHKIFEDDYQLLEKREVLSGVFKDPRELNWAWQYKSIEEDQIDAAETSDQIED